MNDLLSSGIGFDSTDTSLQNRKHKPIWHLTPLPLSQINPYFQSHRTHTGPVKALSSLCLSKISSHFHLFTPTSFTTLPELLIRRVLDKVSSDRRYDHTSHNGTNRPDEITIWSYYATLLPLFTESEQSTQTLGIPIDLTLQHITPNPLTSPEKQIHPFISIPKLYHSFNPISTMTFLTSLTLTSDVDDHSIQSLRYLTHLSALWTVKCGVTDYGLRLLGSAIDLPGPCHEGEEGNSGNQGSQGKGGREGKGMWRLRFWSLRGCKGVTDRGVKGLAKWPGLCLLDLRDTSCTPTALDIFNRSSRHTFEFQNADMQSCTEGLLALFDPTSSPSEIISKLSYTLLKPADSNRLGYLGLHLVPSNTPIPPEHLPFSSDFDIDPSQRRFNKSKAAVYRSGLGHLYGSNVRKVTDEAVHFRNRVSLAKRSQKEKAVDEVLLDAGRLPRYSKPDDMTWKKWNARVERLERGEAKERGEVVEKGMTERERVKTQKGYKEKLDLHGEGADGRSKAFVAGGRDGQRGRGGGKKGLQKEEEVLVKGDKRLMMVRMVSEHWERLTWATGIGVVDGGQGQEVVAAAALSSQKGSGKLIDDILGSASVSQAIRSPLASSQQLSSPPQSRPFLSPVTASPIHPPRPKPVNPFRKSTTLSSSSSGIRPLGPSGSTTNLNYNLQFKLKEESPSLIKSVPPIFRALIPPLYTQATHTPVSLIPRSEAGGLDLNLDFAVNGRKRNFDGVSPNTGDSRKGMKLFGGKR